MTKRMTENKAAMIETQFRREVPVLASKQRQIEWLTEITQVENLGDGDFAALAFRLGICKTKAEAKRLSVNY